MDEDKQYRRDLFAGFALIGMVMNGNRPFATMHEEAYRHADAMEEARNATPEEGGIVSVKRVRKSK